MEVRGPRLFNPYRSVGRPAVVQPRELQELDRIVGEQENEEVGTGSPTLPWENQEARLLMPNSLDQPTSCFLERTRDFQADRLRSLQVEDHIGGLQGFDLDGGGLCPL
jgi:hypothetical protein